MSAHVQSLATAGAGGLIIDIECHLSNNLPNIVIVGFANKAVGEARERLRGAFANSNLYLPRKRITINLAPADIPKDDSGFDLAIAVSILMASEQLPVRLSKQHAIIGELALDGTIRPVRGIIGKLLAGRAQGITDFFIPAANQQQAQLVPHVTLYAVPHLYDLYNHLTEAIPIKPVVTGEGLYESVQDQAVFPLQVSDVVGQRQAKRALEIAAAGGHNLFFSGPPGTGKSMLAKALPSILPPLSQEEILEVTHLHSLASHDYERIITERPFRSPHHSASHVAIIGGGQPLRPGEISLSHRGVLFFDELPEFSRLTLEALRQPLEDRLISIARAKETVKYPANFIMVATANPCPCGYYGTGTCRCPAFQVLQYQQRLSGPILDRIDLYSSVHEIDHAKLLRSASPADADQIIRGSILAARQRQAVRFRRRSKLNADMTNADIRQYCQLSAPARSTLNTAARNLNFSARAYMRLIKVGRTVADLDKSDLITEGHISEAIRYRLHQAKH